MSNVTMEASGDKKSALGKCATTGIHKLTDAGVLGTKLESNHDSTATLIPDNRNTFYQIAANANDSEDSSSDSSDLSTTSSELTVHHEAHQCHRQAPPQTTSTQSPCCGHGDFTDTDTYDSSTSSDEDLFDDGNYEYMDQDDGDCDEDDNNASGVYKFLPNKCLIQ